VLTVLVFQIKIRTNTHIQQMLNYIKQSKAGLQNTGVLIHSIDLNYSLFLWISFKNGTFTRCANWDAGNCPPVYMSKEALSPQTFGLIEKSVMSAIFDIFFGFLFVAPLHILNKLKFFIKVLERCHIYGGPLGTCIFRRKLYLFHRI
jgi:hypothetical protein